jgi:hypothetical protein
LPAKLHHLAIERPIGLVKEPDKVDFYVLDKTWTDEERKELSTFIKLRKGQKKVKNDRTVKKKTIV